MACDCCGGGKTPPIPDISQKLVIVTLLWLAIFIAWPNFISWLMFNVLPFSQDDTFGQFLYTSMDVAGHLALLLSALTFITVWLQTPIRLNTLRKHFNGRGPLLQLIIAMYYGALMPRQAIDTYALFLGLGRIHRPRAAATAYLAANLLFNKTLVAIAYSVAGYECTLAYLVVASTASLLSGFLINTSCLSLPVRAVMMLNTQQTTPTIETQPCLHERYDMAQMQTRQALKKSAIWILLGSVIFALLLKGALIAWILVIALGAWTFRQWNKQDPLLLLPVMNERSTRLFYGYAVLILTIIGLTIVGVA